MILATNIVARQCAVSGGGLSVNRIHSFITTAVHSDFSILQLYSKRRTVSNSTVYIILTTHYSHSAGRSTWYRAVCSHVSVHTPTRLFTPRTVGESGVSGMGQGAMVC